MGNFMSNQEIEGWEAFDKGKPRAANPYPTDSKEYEDWDDGWGEASQ